MNNGKTFSMPRELATKWLAALRSGHYKQCEGKLCDDKGGYCCLGVLQHVADGDVERDTNHNARALPSRLWVTAHGIPLKTAFEDFNPTLPSIDMDCAAANDGDHLDRTYIDEEGEYRPLTFHEIADLIERHMKIIE